MLKKSNYLFWTGIAIVVMAFFIDVMYVGIPYQDPPRELQLRYERDQLIVSWLMKIGWIIAITGGVLFLSRRLKSVRQKK